MNRLIKIAKRLTLEEQEYFILSLCNLLTEDGRTITGGEFSMNDVWFAITRPDNEILDALLKTQSFFGADFSLKEEVK